MHVSYSNFYLPISPFLNKAFKALGLSQILGFNSGKLIGYSHLTDAIDPQAETRSSSETSFLAEAVQTTTLQIYKQTLAKKILFTGKKATGVQVQTAGVGYTISARKEVILAAGVVRQKLVSKDEKFNTYPKDRSGHHSFSWCLALDPKLVCRIWEYQLSQI